MTILLSSCFSQAVTLTSHKCSVNQVMLTTVMSSYVCMKIYSRAWIACHCFGIGVVHIYGSTKVSTEGCLHLDSMTHICAECEIIRILKFAINVNNRHVSNAIELMTKVVTKH